MKPEITTVSGRVVSFVDPKPETISLEDIAGHLSKLCRFGGATREFYSVAQHSVLVSHIAEALGGSATWGLFHDAAEAYTNDIVTPLKNLIRPQIDPIEERLLDAIGKAAGLDFRGRHWPTIKEADRLALNAEAAKLLNNCHWVNKKAVKTFDRLLPLYSDGLIPWSPVMAEKLFMKRYGEMMRDEAAA